ncbi:MAG: SLC13 family permease [Parvularculaceae bacterium]
MIPLSFICILGGMTTLIGSSTNLLVADSFRSLSGQEIRFFDFTLPGLALAAIGALYIIILGRGLLPDRAPPEAAHLALRDGKQFIAQIRVTPGHPLVGKRSVAGMFPDLPEVTVRAVIRRDRTLLPPFDDFEVRPGDVIIIAATRATLTKFVKSKPEFLAGLIFQEGTAPEEGVPALPSGELKLVEAVVAPGSRMIGRTVEQIGFFYQTGCVLMGVQRRSRMIRVKMNDIRIEAGDVFLVLGTREDIRNLRNSRDLLPLEWSMTDVPEFKAVMKARAIFAGVVLAIAATPIEPVIPAMLGAAAMVFVGGLNIRQASRALDVRIFMLIAAALAMGMALERTGGAAFLAHGLVSAIGPLGETALLSALFLVTAVITNILTNNATAVLLTPIAYSAASQLGYDPLPFIFTVIFGANCSFATPMAYQTNLLVMGPGHYKFRDFLIFGGPLVVILWLGYTAFAPKMFAEMGLM